MHTNEALELYECVKSDMKFLITSDVRSKIIISLKEGPKDLADLRNDINFSSSTILHGMYLLEEKKLIYRGSGRYYLSQTGELAVLKLINMMQACSAMKKTRRIFLDHEIGVIPQHLRSEIECLESCCVVESTSQDLTRPYNLLQKKVAGASKVYFVSAVFYPFYLDLLHKAENQKLALNFMLTRDVIESINELQEDVFDNLSSLSRVNFWEIPSDLKISFTLTDQFMALGLFSANGVYDPNKFLMGDGSKVLNWGNRLFNHYLKQAVRFKL